MPRCYSFPDGAFGQENESVAAGANPAGHAPEAQIQGRVEYTMHKCQSSATDPPPAPIPTTLARAVITRPYHPANHPLRFLHQ